MLNVYRGDFYRFSLPLILIEVPMQAICHMEKCGDNFSEA